MYQITARGPRASIESAWDALAWTDPSPAGAVDAKEDTRLTWRLAAYADDANSAEACAEIIRETSPDLNPVVEVLPDRDWVTLSLEGLPPVKAGRFIVAGSHALAATAPGKTDILIEAGPAFGTGHHGTTLGCLLGYEHILKTGVPKPFSTLELGRASWRLRLSRRELSARLAPKSMRKASLLRMTMRLKIMSESASVLIIHAVLAMRLFSLQRLSTSSSPTFWPNRLSGSRQRFVG